jgi:tRNA G18 (ribose-2'-O)-methylase SpoU
MMEICRIDSLDSAELQPYRTLRRATEHIKQGIFVAEGEKVVSRLLDAQIEVVSLLLTEAWQEELGPSIEKRGVGNIKVWVAPKHLLESIVGFHLHQGVMAIGKIPRPVGLAEAIESDIKPHLVVALDGLTNADNIGVIVRNCVTFGVNALIVPQNTSSPYLRRAVRMSMGAVFRLPIVSVENLAPSLRKLTNQFGTRIIVTHPQPDATSIEDADLNGSVCLVLGSEGKGISSEVLETCSEKVSIPMTLETDSLNVATASGIFLFEAARKRRHRLAQNRPD